MAEGADSTRLRWGGAYTVRDSHVPLTAGARLGPFGIQSALRAGGSGKLRTRLLLAGLAWLMLAASAAAERLPLKAYTTADGLPHNEINRIVRDSRGFLWFCTGDGLSRFDGYGFTNFGTAQGLPHRTVNDLLETRDGRLWVATSLGLALFDPAGVPKRRELSAGVSTATRAMFTVI